MSAEAIHGSTGEVIDETDLVALRFGYPDLSQDSIATEALAQLTEEQREALELFMIRFRLPEDVMRFIRGLVAGYCQKDPQRGSQKAKTTVLDHLRKADVYLSMFYELENMPVLGEDREWEDYPTTGWDVYRVSQFMKDVCRDSRAKISEFVNEVETPTA